MTVRLWTSPDRFIRTMLFDAIQESASMGLVLHLGEREQFILNSRDNMISRSVFTYGQHEVGKLEQAMSILARRRGMNRVELLIDVGANIGTICIPAINRGFAERAVAVEPHPVNCKLLRSNVALNGFTGRIAVHECAAGAVSDQVLQVELAGDNWGDVRVASATDAGASSATAQRYPVASRRVDDLVGNVDPSRTLLWIDTQGFEASVLQGSAALVARRVPLVIELDPSLLARQPGGVPALVRAVAGYEVFTDLEDPARARPIAELETLCAEMVAARRQFTDLLVL